MTERHGPTRRRHLVDLSVIATSALLLGGSVLVIAQVDGQRPVVTTLAAPVAPAAATVEARVATAPAPGLAPAPRPAPRRVVVVRRSRPS